MVLVVVVYVVYVYRYALGGLVALPFGSRALGCHLLEGPLFTALQPLLRHSDA